MSTGAARKAPDDQMGENERPDFRRLIVRRPPLTRPVRDLLAWMVPAGRHDGAAAGQGLLMRYVELRRHTDNEGDRLTLQGAADAEMVGRDRPHPPDPPAVSTGRRRPTHMLEI